MILVTVGTQLPFPRLTRAVARFAASHGEETVIQSGGEGAAAGAESCPGITVRPSIPPKEFEALFSRARVVAAHAGIGTILTAQRLGRPLVILPRRASLGEHRNDHQVATARHVAELPGIYVAWEADDLARLLSRDDLEVARPGEGAGRGRLVARIRDFLDTGDGSGV